MRPIGIVEIEPFNWFTGIWWNLRICYGYKEILHLVWWWTLYWLMLSIYVYTIYLPVVVLSNISMIHFDSRPISRELKGRTRTATFTDDILAVRGPKMA